MSRAAECLYCKSTRGTKTIAFPAYQECLCPRCTRIARRMTALRPRRKGPLMARGFKK